MDITTTREYLDLRLAGATHEEALRQIEISNA